jgi:hypothetical protein
MRAGKPPTPNYSVLKNIDFKGSVFFQINVFNVIIHCRCYMSLKNVFCRIVRPLSAIWTHPKVEAVNQLNCCTRPQLHTVKTVYEASHDAEWLQQCRKCKTYWFKRFYEWVDWSGGNDEITTWYTKLTEDEAKIILQTKERKELDLSYLEDRESIMDDGSSLRNTKGQPSHPSR